MSLYSIAARMIADAKKHYNGALKSAPVVGLERGLQISLHYVGDRYELAAWRAGGVLPDAKELHALIAPFCVPLAIAWSLVDSRYVIAWPAGPVALPRVGYTRIVPFLGGTPASSRPAARSSAVLLAPEMDARDQWWDSRAWGYWRALQRGQADRAGLYLSCLEIAPAAWWDHARAVYDQAVAGGFGDHSPAWASCFRAALDQYETIKRKQQGVINGEFAGAP